MPGALVVSEATSTGQSWSKGEWGTEFDWTTSLSTDNIGRHLLLQPGEINLNLETKPAHPDPIDMDEDGSIYCMLYNCSSFFSNLLQRRN